MWLCHDMYRIVICIVSCISNVCVPDFPSPRSLSTETKEFDLLWFGIRVSLLLHQLLAKADEFDLPRFGIDVVLLLDPT